MHTSSSTHTHRHTNTQTDRLTLSLSLSLSLRLWTSSGLANAALRWKGLERFVSAQTDSSVAAVAGGRRSDSLFDFFFFFFSKSGASNIFSSSLAFLGHPAEANARQRSSHSTQNTSRPWHSSGAMQPCLLSLAGDFLRGVTALSRHFSLPQSGRTRCKWSVPRQLYYSSLEELSFQLQGACSDFYWEASRAKVSTKSSTPRSKGILTSAVVSN